MYKKLNIVFLFLSTSFVLFSCKCDEYFSNSKNKIIENRLFNLVCHIRPSVVQEEMDIMEVWIDFKDEEKQKVVRETLRVYPIVENHDTLKLKSKYASVYSFYYNTNWNIKTIKIDYEIEAMGNTVNKEEIFSNLKRIRKCRYRPALH